MSWGVVGYHAFDDAAQFETEMARIIETRGRRPSRIVTGGSVGADALAMDWALGQKPPLEYKGHYPKGMAALTDVQNQLRYKAVIEDCELLIVFLSKNSKGSHDAIKMARDANFPLEIVNVD